MKRRFIGTCQLGLTMFLLTIPLMAQQKGKPRVFVTNSESWEVSGGFGGKREGFGGSINGGARPQTAEIAKTLNKLCPECIVTMKQEKADYILMLDHEGGKDPFRQDNKYVLFNKGGDAIKSGSTRILGNAIKDACKALTKDWQSGG